MVSTVSRDQSVSDRGHQWMAGVLLAGLLFLRLPFFVGMAFLAPASMRWVVPVSEVGTYLLTAILIWWEKDRLADFHIDTLALAIIILFKPAQTIVSSLRGLERDISVLSLPGLAVWAIALGLFLALRKSHVALPKVQAAHLKWFGVGILVGLITAILLGYPTSFQVAPSEADDPLDAVHLLLSIVPIFIYELGFAAITEEPLFRGFLWGYLRKARWQEKWIWLFQAGVFWLAHAYYINKLPISFWMGAPISILMLGLLAWRSRSIATSMAAHAIGNAVGFTFALLFAKLRYGL